jgi:hypothetical protein
VHEFTVRGINLFRFVFLAEKISPSSSHVFYIGVGCACGAIVVVALTVLACYVRSHKPGTEHFRLDHCNTIRGESRCIVAREPRTAFCFDE